MKDDELKRTMKDNRYKRIKKSGIWETLTLWTNVNRSTGTIVLCFFAVIVSWKCCGNGIEVLLKCRCAAHSQQPTAIATDLPLLTSQLSTVGWSKTACLNNLGKNQDPTFFNCFIVGQY